MFTKAIIIEGVGHEVLIARKLPGVEAERGVSFARCGERTVRFSCDENERMLQATTQIVCEWVYGVNKRGEVAATNSERHEVRAVLEQLADF